MKYAAIICALVLGVFASSALYAAEGLPFYRSKPVHPVTTKTEFLKKVERGDLRISGEALARRLSKTAGEDLRSKSDLVKFLERGDVAVRPCDWRAGEVSVDYVRRGRSPWGPRFESWNRACYPNEYVLVYRGKAILSLLCGNTITDPRKAIVQTTPTPKAIPAPNIVRIIPCDENRQMVASDSGDRHSFGFGVFGGFGWDTFGGIFSGTEHGNGGPETTQTHNGCK